MKTKEQGKISGGGKTLLDYPAIPGTPPPEPKKDQEVAYLERELAREKVYVSVLKSENREIEKILQDFDKEIAFVRGNFPHGPDDDGRVHASNEHWFKCEAQAEVNRKLEREKRLLESEIKQMEDQGMINLDSLTQSELILYVKQLERTKTDLLSELRAKEWSLDKQAKDYHHLKETKRALEAEIRHYDGEHALFHHYKKMSCPSAGVSLSLQSSARRTRPPRQKDGDRKLIDGKPLRRGNSISHENISASAETGIAFRSADDYKLKDPKGSVLRRGRSVKDAATERKKMDSKKVCVKAAASVGSLPELSKISPKTVRSRSVDKIVGKRCDTGSSVNATVADESDVEEVSVKAVKRSGRDSPISWGSSATESGIGSPSESAENYEDDFEESDGES